MRLRIWGQTHAEKSSAAQSSGLTLFGENLNHLWISFGRGFPVPRVSLLEELLRDDPDALRRTGFGGCSGSSLVMPQIWSCVGKGPSRGWIVEVGYQQAFVYSRTGIGNIPGVAGEGGGSLDSMGFLTGGRLELGQGLVRSSSVPFINHPCLRVP